MDIKNKDENGFTLIELLVVVAIIGILAAIAIPQFSAYRNQGFNARSSSDLRNLATAQEAFFAQQATYQEDPASLPGFRQSPGVTVTVADNGDGTFIATAVHSATGEMYTWSSGAGGLQ
ncbi:MAG: prepilin-type N-terminal cleavage/methylation domain-containing protein [Deltaproteobacteria bacterium]